MLEMNKVMLIGNLTRDVETMALGNGTPLAKFGLAINQRYKNKDGDYKTDATFVDVEAWRKTAEFAGKYLKKGRRVYVEGRLKFDKWQADDGSNRTKLTVTADRIQFADSKKDSDSTAPQPAPAPAPTPTEPGTGGDDLPF